MSEKKAAVAAPEPPSEARQWMLRQVAAALRVAGWFGGRK